ncbi:MAG: Calx-beta domain-containing protein [Pyrinomonadaceae bacterium]
MSRHSDVLWHMAAASSLEERVNQMLHTQDSSHRLRLPFILVLVLCGATGQAYSQSLTEPSKLLGEAAPIKVESRSAPPSTAGGAPGANAAPCEKAGRDVNCRPAAAEPSPKAGAGGVPAQQPSFVPAPRGAQSVTTTLQFGATSFNVPEGGGSVTLTVTRAGAVDSAVSVEYRVSGKTASQASDFTFVAGTLTFASGEASKTFNVLITNDSYVEGTEVAEATLGNVTGEATLANPSTASLVIADDALEPAQNPNSEPEPFVIEHYNDFLGREPDAQGLDFWTKEITQCGSDLQCTEVKRINVSGAFYLSIEFQQTGSFVYRTHKAAFGNLPDAPAPVRFENFLRDTQAAAKDVVVGQGNWQRQIERNHATFALDFVRRTEFKARYPATTSPSDFVNSLDTNTGGLLSSDKKAALIRELSPNPSDETLRASVLTEVVADPQFTKAEFNRAFVLMQYYGYLRRNPDDAPEANRDFAGYNYWLAKLNQFSGDYIGAEMVKAFITSDEYRRRFGPLRSENQRPAVDAGSEQTILIYNPARLSAKVSDDILPEGHTLALSWSKVSGPGSVTFREAGSASTEAVFELPGTYVLRLTANDSQLSGSGDVTVIVERTPPPSITAVLNPAPNAAGWNNSDVTVTFNCADAVSGIETCPAPVVVNAETDGRIVSGIAVNKGGESATTSVTVRLDKTPPSLGVTSPADGASLFTTPATVNGTVSDALSGLAGLTCNGAPAALNANAFNCAIQLALGTNPVLATAVDVAGNMSKVDRAFVYTRVPVVSITSPSNLSYVNITPTTVTGTVDDPTATVTVNSVQAAVVNGGFSVALPLAEGPNVVTASASTQAGATGTASAQVTLDTTPPRVTITSPPDGFVTTAEKISVAGSINDIVVGTVNEEQAQVAVNGAQADVANRTFLGADVPLTVGQNVIRAVGRDRVGNSFTTLITVTRQAAAQARITLVSGNNQAGPVGAPLAAPLVVSLKDESGQPAQGKTVVFKVTQNDGVVSAGGSPAATILATTDAQGEARANWKLGMRAGAGGNSVDAYAVGFEGTAIFTASGAQGQAGKIIVDTGNDQMGVINKPLPKPLIAVVTDEGHNRLANVPVTFTVKEGGGSFDGNITFTVNTDSDGRAAATLTLGMQEGNANNLVEVNFPSNVSFPASFTASGRAPGDPVQTTIKGVVLDNSNVPIPGVTVRAVLTNVINSNGFAVQQAASVQTDAQGQFTITQAPVGFVKLLVDGATATRPGTYPSLEYDMVTVAGQVNTVGGPVFLLPLNDANKLCVTATDGGGTLTIPEAPGFSLTFGPGQVTFPGGSKEGCVSVTVVHGDKVPMVPGFGQQPRFIVTIQPSGAVFNTPARITLPNVDGLSPRAVTEMYSFDHDIGSFVAIGTGVVSADGRVITSSPGVGVIKAGWHCGGDPVANGTVADCPDCKLCLNNTCNNPDPAQENKKCSTAAVPHGVCKSGNCEPIKVELDVASATITLLDMNTLTAKVTPTGGSGEITKYKFEIKRTSEATWHTLQEDASGTFSKKAKVAGKFKVRLTATLSDGTETTSPEKDLEVQFPSYADIVGDGDVVSATDAAWAATLADATPTQRRERGFWIRLNTSTEKYEVTSTDFGPFVGNAGQGTVNLSPKPADSPASPTPLDTPTYTVASFHTHTPTFYRTSGRVVGPSNQDGIADMADNVTGVVYDYEGNALGEAPPGWPLNSPARRYRSGPNRRSTP